MRSFTSQISGAAPLWSCAAIDGHSEVIKSLDDCRLTKSDNVPQTEAYLIIMLLQMTRHCAVPHNEQRFIRCLPATLSASGGVGDKFARYPPRALPNCTGDEGGRLMEASWSCWLWDRNTRCCLQAQSQPVNWDDSHRLCSTPKLTVYVLTAFFFFFSLINSRSHT